LSSPEELQALAKRFFDSVEQGDIDALVDCYAEDAEIWHNTDEMIQGPQDNKKILSGMVTRIVDRFCSNTSCAAPACRTASESTFPRASSVPSRMARSRV
jgi:ketosteroid isomerase-like protein